MAFPRCLVPLVEPSTSTNASPLPPERGERLCYTESYRPSSTLLDLRSMIVVCVFPCTLAGQLKSPNVFWRRGWYGALLGLWFYVRAALLLVMVTVLLVLQAKAQQQRDRIQEEKTYRSRMITEKVPSQPPPSPPPPTHTHTNAVLLTPTPSDSRGQRES